MYKKLEQRDISKTAQASPVLFRQWNTETTIREQKKYLHVSWGNQTVARKRLWNQILQPNSWLPAGPVPLKKYPRLNKSQNEKYFIIFFKSQKHKTIVLLRDQTHRKQNQKYRKWWPLGSWGCQEDLGHWSACSLPCSPKACLTF